MWYLKRYLLCTILPLCYQVIFIFPEFSYNWISLKNDEWISNSVDVRDSFSKCRKTSRLLLKWWSLWLIYKYLVKTEILLSPEWDFAMKFYSTFFEARSKWRVYDWCVAIKHSEYWIFYRSIRNLLSRVEIVIILILVLIISRHIWFWSKRWIHE